MTVFLDTNVVMDVLCKSRNNLFPDSIDLVNLCYFKKIDGYISALTVMNCVYQMRHENKSQAEKRNMIKNLLQTFNIVELDRNQIEKAVNMNFDDFEDYVQLQAAVKCKADYVVTRDEKNTFPPNGTLQMKIIEPKDLMPILKKQYNIYL